MKSPIVILASFIAASAFAAVAADAPKKALSPQQQRMSDCSKESKGMKGDEHKKFMSECLKSQSAPSDVKAGMMKPDAKAETAAAKPTQQDKMKTCNADAGKKKLKGDERKKFMSDCLKG